MMANIAGSLSVFIGAYGLFHSGPLGALTGFIAPMAVLTPIGVFFSDQNAGLSASKPASLSQKIACPIIIIIFMAGIPFAGWRWGWALAILSVVAGPLITLPLAYILHEMLGSGGNK